MAETTPTSWVVSFYSGEWLDRHHHVGAALRSAGELLGPVGRAGRVRRPVEQLLVDIVDERRITELAGAGGDIRVSPERQDSMLATLGLHRAALVRSESHGVDRTDRRPL